MQRSGIKVSTSQYSHALPPNMMPRTHTPPTLFCSLSIFKKLNHVNREYSYGRLVTSYFANGILSYVQRIGDNNFFKYKRAFAEFTNIEGVRHLGNHVGEISFGSADDGSAFMKIHASEDLVKFITSFNNLPSYKDDLGLRIGLNINLNLSPTGTLEIRDFLSGFFNKARHPDNGNKSVRASHIIKSLGSLKIGSQKNDSIEQIKSHLQSPEYIDESEVNTLEKLLTEEINSLEWANR
jgi:hypothetical protein